MPQYLLSVWAVEDAPAPTQAEMERAYQEVDGFNAELKALGAWVFAGGLQAADTASVVDGRAVEVVTTSGPFAAAETQLGGFWIIEAPDLDAARRLAGRASKACAAPVEVRPFQEDLPTA